MVSGGGRNIKNGQIESAGSPDPRIGADKNRRELTTRAYIKSAAVIDNPIDEDRWKIVAPRRGRGDQLSRRRSSFRCGKRQRISYLRRSSVPEIPPFPPTKLAGDMFIVNESYSGGGSWRTATCPGGGGGGGGGGGEKS